VHLVCQWNLNVLQKLIAKGGDIYKLDKNFMSCLHYAAESSNDVSDIIWLLVSKGLNVNARDIDGETPLLKASMFGHFNNIKALIELGANVSITSKNGSTCLHYTSESCKDTSEVIKLLVSNGLDLNAKDENGNTPLHSAARSGHVNNVKELIKLGTNLSITNNHRDNALHVCDSDEKRDILKAETENFMEID